jgi:uncharacterized protein YcnI
MRRSVEAILLGTAISLVPAIAAAHISIASGPGYANTTQIIKFAVGHGCEGMDTYSVRVEIPPSVTSVRPMPSDFGRVSIETDATGAVIAVTWQRTEQETLPSDLAYYELSIRARIGDNAFSTVYFPTHQVCRGPDGGTSVSDWVATDPDSGAEPAPAVMVVPARKQGWNKFTATQAVSNLGLYFPDALIVWKGNAAYSPNAATTELIKTTPGVTALTAISTGDELWVKY